MWKSKRKPFLRTKGQSRVVGQHKKKSARSAAELLKNASNASFRDKEYERDQTRVKGDRSLHLGNSDAADLRAEELENERRRLLNLPTLDELSEGDIDDDDAEFLADDEDDVFVPSESDDEEEESDMESDESESESYDDDDEDELSIESASYSDEGEKQKKKRKQKKKKKHKKKLVTKITDDLEWEMVPRWEEKAHLDRLEQLRERDAKLTRARGAPGSQVIRQFIDLEDDNDDDSDSDSDAEGGNSDLSHSIEGEYGLDGAEAMNGDGSADSLDLENALECMEEAHQRLLTEIPCSPDEQRRLLFRKLQKMPRGLVVLRLLRDLSRAQVERILGPLTDERLTLSEETQKEITLEQNQSYRRIFVRPFSYHLRVPSPKDYIQSTRTSVIHEVACLLSSGIPLAGDTLMDYRNKREAGAHELIMALDAGIQLLKESVENTDASAAPATSAPLANAKALRGNVDIEAVLLSFRNESGKKTTPLSWGALCADKKFSMHYKGVPIQGEQEIKRLTGLDAITPPQEAKLDGARFAASTKRHFRRYCMFSEWILANFAMFCWHTVAAFRSHTVDELSVNSRDLMDVVETNLVAVSHAYRQWFRKCLTFGGPVRGDNGTLPGVVKDVLFGNARACVDMEKWVTRFREQYDHDFGTVFAMVRAAREDDRLSVVSLTLESIFQQQQQQQQQSNGAVSSGTLDTEQTNEDGEEETADTTMECPENIYDVEHRKPFALVFHMVDGQSVFMSLPAGAAQQAYAVWRLFLYPELTAVGMLHRLFDGLNSSRHQDSTDLQKLREANAPSPPAEVVAGDQEQDEAALPTPAPTSDILEESGPQYVLRKSLDRSAVLKTLVGSRPYGKEGEVLAHYWYGGYIRFMFLQARLTRRKSQVSNGNTNNNNNNKKKKEKEKQPQAKGRNGDDDDDDDDDDDVIIVPSRVVRTGKDVAATNTDTPEADPPEALDQPQKRVKLTTRATAPVLDDDDDDDDDDDE